MKVNELLNHFDEINSHVVTFRTSRSCQEIASTTNYSLLSVLFGNYEIEKWNVVVHPEAMGYSVEVTLLDYDGDRPNVNIVSHETSLEKMFQSQDPSDHDNDDIRNLKLTRRAFNCLHRAGIQSIGDLREFTADELLAIDRFGKHSLRDVQNELKAYGLHLKED